ncbi:MAG TPA: glycosyl transferase group 1 [Cyanobacteria bacterium UBA11149]|nr:glycosyl transferase group 1 [Cyanobacteria bacterium UBA11367]HBE56632.1 glycosyl transferase group 1 [Cyanobacteria bacterium UBA11366]HBK65162.1 glycosyl transferase group 1 [Cyanobacteria bacterium UBA11166]HBR74774.1 glycosyl transferase group 1 [Cyanobacteria bacterium UBA11159]HBS70036.1 glycosyl transferase group 1 [Cyanobacteria bacterium UBA11153]HBW92012.1 glycosyl transferase group 1 [Cyanobacteria bacterium UBA11149]HCA95903.1 glycosyl transferase group 1 [Cyanobacteria bacter
MSKPLKILQIVPSISLIYGGPSQMVMGLSSALAAQGVEVTILTTDSNGDFGQAPLDVPLNRPVPQDGYEVRYFRCYPFRRYKFSLDLLRWLWENARNYDVAHIHALFSPVTSVSAMIARRKKLPYILRPLGTLDPADLQKKRQLKKIYAALLEKPNLAGAAGVHFTSKEEAKISERFGTNPPDIIIPLGVKSPTMPARCEARRRWGISDEKPLLLFMSRIDPKKGLDLLIPALERLLASGVNFHFVLAGTNPQDPDYEKQISEQVKTSTLSSCTTITGFVTGELKAALLQDADLFVLASYYENFGIAVAEAMVAGTAVVISDGVHIWEDVKGAEAGWVCGCEVDALTEVLQEALADVGEQKRRGRNAREYALTNYSWDAIANLMIHAYQQVLSQDFHPL